MAKIFGRWLDTTKKKIVFGGMVCFLLSWLIPPLMCVYPPHVYRGYGFIFLPENWGGIAYDEMIDFYRLFIEWFVVIVFTVGFLFSSTEQKPK